MRRLTIVVLFTLIAFTGYNQKTLSQDAIKDFSSHLLLQYKYGSDFTRTQINYSLAREGYDFEYAVTVIENAGANKGYREVMFKCIYKAYKKREQIFDFLYSLEMSAVHATEVADYIYDKCSKEEQLEREEDAKQEVEKQKQALEVKKKYEVEHADEIRVQDSIDKVKQEEDAKVKLAQEELAKKEAFLNSTPDLQEIILLFDKSPENVYEYLKESGYIKLKEDKQSETYIKNGAKNDSLALAIRFKKSQLQSFYFRTKANINKMEVIRDTLKNTLHFEKMYGYVERNNKGEYTGTVESYKNKEQNIRCILTTDSYTKDFILSIGFFK